MGFSLRPETYIQLSERDQTTWGMGDTQVVQTKFDKMTAELRRWKLARRTPKGKTILRRIKKLAKLDVEYPPELLAARKAAFLRQIEIKNATADFADQP